MLLAGVALKLVPLMVTVVPTGPEVGVKEVMVGNAVIVTTKSVALVAVLQPMVTVIFPVVAPAGTVVLMVVEVEAVTDVAMPLKLKMLFVGIISKLVPVIVTEAPIAPEIGVYEVIEGGEILPMVVRNTDTVLLLTFGDTTSAFPSPSRSPMETK